LGPLQDLSYETTVKFPEGYAPVFRENRLSAKPTLRNFWRPMKSRRGADRKVPPEDFASEIPAAERSSYSAFADAVRQEMSRYILISTSTPDTPSSNSTPSTPNPPRKK
jgi:hypothetical protein